MFIFILCLCFFGKGWGRGVVGGRCIYEVHKFWNGCDKRCLDFGPCLTSCDDQVDVYSFGIVMWELVTGEEPYADLHYGAIIGKSCTLI